MPELKKPNIRTDFSNCQVDFSKIEKIEFHCLEQCGRCCFHQAPIVTTTEISEISKCLKAKSYRQLSDFAIDYFTFNNSLDRITNELINTCIEGLKWFWAPFQLVEAEDCILVRNYAIYSMPSTGRCALLNPIDMKCLVYDSRPMTCRMYPFTLEITQEDLWSLELIENCSGLKAGTMNLDKDGINKLLQDNAKNVAKDTIVFEEYIAKNCIKLLEPRTSHKISKPEDVKNAIKEFERDWQKAYYLHEGNQRFDQAMKKGTKFVEPLAEEGLVPATPLIVAYNQQIANKKKHKNERKRKHS
jgi:Fe-S-cluster containining protein